MLLEPPKPIAPPHTMSSSTSDKKAKKRERDRELRESTGCGFRKDLVADRHLDDQRYERSRAANAAGQSAMAPPTGIPGLTPGGPPASATMDTILRMQAGLGLRTIADNINDPNRPTWEEVGLGLGLSWWACDGGGGSGGSMV